MLKNNVFSKKGFTLIELLIVIAIISIMASVVLVSINSSRTRARDAGAFAILKSVQTSAYMCLLEGVRVDGAFARINWPKNPAGKNVCVWQTGGAELIASYGTWPTEDLAANAWVPVNVGWCNPFYADSINPPSDCIYYVNGTCGGDRDTTNFCYHFVNEDNGSKHIGCTDSGCFKSGF